MKTEKHYRCPTCGGYYHTRQEAERCRGKHPIQETEYIYCEMCGEGWSINAYGPETAAGYAKACEATHIAKGEAEKKAAGLFFFSGGVLGKVRVIDTTRR